MDKIGTSLKNLLSDKVTTTWQLLSETDYFLSKAGLISSYENQIRELRKRLNLASNPVKEKLIREVHSEIVDIRKELRLLGYDVSLGKHRLVFDGFRHDDSISKGFKRIVLFISDDCFFWLTGEANHLELAQILEQQIVRKTVKITGKHYLWYLRTKQELILCGAASEMKEDYERLKAFGEASSLLFLSRLKNLY